MQHVFPMVVFMINAALPSPHMFRLKAAFRDLVDVAGGIDRAARLSNYGKTSIHRYLSPECPDMVPLSVVVVLETDTGSPLVTRAMAALQGQSLTPPQAGDALQREGGGVLNRWADITQGFSKLAGGLAFAMADGEITMAEGRALDESLAAVAAQVEAMRQTLTTHNGKSLKVVS